MQVKRLLVHIEAVELEGIGWLSLDENELMLKVEPYSTFLSIEANEKTTNEDKTIYAYDSAVGVDGRSEGS